MPLLCLLIGEKRDASMPNWAEYVRSHLRLSGVRAEIEAEIVDDLAQQLEDAYQDALARGVSEPEAASVAQRHIQDWPALARGIQHTARVRGSVALRWETAAADAAETRAWWSSIAATGRDLLFSARMLRKNIAFTLVAVLTLALGIGANSAIFSAVHRVLLQPLPFYQPERLVSFSEVVHGGQWNVSLPNFLDWRARNHVFEDMAIYRKWGSAMLRTTDGPVLLKEGDTEARLFPLLGARFLLGRPFTEAERQAGMPLAVLSYPAWNRYFGRDPHIVGKTLVVDNQPVTVVGVLADFPVAAYGERDVWFPLETKFHPNVLDRSNHPGLSAIARLRPGVNLPQAQEEMSAIARSLAKEYPASNTDVGVRVQPLREDIVGNMRMILLVLFASVGFVLLISCANVAHMVLARAAVRRREAAVRAALGASRGRLIRLFLSEATLLALAGGAAGLAMATWMVAGLRVLAAQLLPTMSDITVDPSVFLFTLGVTLVAGLAFGLAPALALAGAEPAGALGQSGRSGMSSPAHRKLRKGLIAAEVAFSMILLCGAGLMLRSLERMLGQDLGFQADHALALSLRPPYQIPRSPEQSATYIRSLLDRLAATPGVRSSAATWPGPENGWTPSINFKEHPVAEGHEPTVQAAAITPDYFTTMGIPLHAGRAFTAEDRAGAPLVAIVNEEFARRFFPNESPLGKHFASLGAVTIKGWAEIVGVAGDTRGFDLSGKVYPEIYWPFDQFAQRDPGIVVRTAADPGEIASTVRQAIRSVDPDVLVYNIKTFDEIVAQPTQRQRFTRLLLTCFSALALLLAAIGVYGLLEYTVAQRRQEIGVRIALGATARSVQALVLRQTLLPVGMGIAAGLGGALLLTRFLRSLLFGVGVFDPPTFAAVTLVLAIAALLAAWAPARAAARVDPVVALRSE